MTAEQQITLQLLREMVYKYEPHRPLDDVECGYCAKQFDSEDFHDPESHQRSCTYAAAVRHLATLDVGAVQP